MLKSIINFLMAAAFVSLTACATHEARPMAGSAALPSKVSLRELPLEGRLLIQEAFLHLRVTNLSQLAKDAEAIVRSQQGYVEASDLTEELRVRLTLRVPSANLEKTLDSLSALGVVENRSISARDVTDEVIDVEAKLKNNAALRDRLRTLLQQTKDVKDVLAVEEQLTRVQAEIDSMEGRLKALKSNTAVAKIILTGERKTVLGPLGYLFTGLWWGISKLFVIR